MSLGFNLSPLAITLALALQSGGATNPTPQLPTNYEPAWISNFTLPAKDADGYTTRQPAANSRIVYIAADGDDVAAQTGDAGVYSLADFSVSTWDNPGTITAFASIPAALAYVRHGYADFVCLKRGDSFDYNAGYNYLSMSGPTASERAYFTSYGDSVAAKPIIDLKGQGEHGFFAIYSNTAITDIHWTCSERDPSSPNFVGWANLPSHTKVGLYRYTPNTDQETIEDVLIENCEFSFLSIGCYFPCDPYPDNIIYRRNFFNFCYDEISMGILGSYRGLLLEDNLAYHCGFYDKFIGTDGGFNRHWHYNTIDTDLTSATTTQITFVNPLPALLSLPRSVPIKMDDGGLDEYVTVTAISGNVATIQEFDFSVRTSTGNKAFEHIIYGVNSGSAVYHTNGALTTATNTIPTNDAVAQNLQAGMTVYLVGIEGYVYNSTIQSVSANQIVLNDTLDFTIDNVVDNDNVYVHCYGASSKNHSFYLSYLTNSILRNNTSIEASGLHYKITTGNSIDAIYSSNVADYSNIGIGGEIGLGAAGNRYSQYTPKLENWTMADNYLLELGINDLSNRGIAWGIDIQDQLNGIAERNFLINSTVTADTFGIRATEGINQGIKLRYNVTSGFGTNGVEYDPNEVSEVVGNCINKTGFVNPAATFYTYMDSIGQVGAGMSEFKDLLAPRDRGNWLTYDQELKDYISAAYVPAAGIFALAQPNPSQTFYDGDTVKLKFDAFSATDIDFQWYQQGVGAMAGETAQELSFVFDHLLHDGLIVYCVGTDQEGNIVTSNTSSISWNQRIYAALTLTDTIAFTSRTLTVGQGFRFRYKCLNAKGRMGGIYDSGNPGGMSFRGAGENAVSLRHSHFNADIPVSNISSVLLDGNDHIIEYTLEASGEYPTVYIDGTPYVASTPNYDVGDTATMIINGINAKTDTYAGDLQLWWDFEIFDTDDSTIDLYAFDSGGIDGATENATTGAGVATFNVDAGTWTLLPSQSIAVTSSTPVDDATGVLLTDNVDIGFNVTPVLNVGYITITNGTDSHAIDVANHAGQLSVASNILTINPTADLADTLSNYYVQIDAGAITDYLGNSFAGISDTVTLNFTTQDVDSTGPQLVSSTPADGSTGIALGADVLMNFDEFIAFGTGNITLTDGGVDSQVIDVTNHAGQLSIVDNVLTINPANDFANNSTNYYVLVDAGAITDIALNAFAGISDPATLNFTTIAPPSNQIPAPNDLTDASWTKEKVSVTANTLTDTAENGYHRVKLNIALPGAGVTEFFSFDATYNDHQYVGINIKCADGNWRNCVFDLVGEVVSAVYGQSYANPVITPLGGGVYACSVEVTDRQATEVTFQMMNTSDVTGGRIYTGTGTTVGMENISVAY